MVMAAVLAWPLGTALARGGDDPCSEIERLLASLDDRNAYTNVPTVLLRAGEAGREALPVLARFAKARSPLQRRAALSALASCGPEAEPVLRRSLDEERDPEVRAVTVLSLGLVGSRAAIPDLIDLARGERARGSKAEVLRLRENAIVVLGALQAQEALPTLVELAVQDRPVRDCAVLALAGLSSFLRPSDLEPLVRSKEIAVRAPGTRLLGGCVDPSAITRLGELLRDESAEVREAAAFALGIQRREEGMASLAVAESDTNARVREAAVEAKGRIEAALGATSGESESDPKVVKTWIDTLSRPIVFERTPGEPRRSGPGFPRVLAGSPNAGAGAGRPAIVVPPTPSSRPCPPNVAPSGGGAGPAPVGPGPSPAPVPAPGPGVSEGGGETGGGGRAPVTPPDGGGDGGSGSGGGGTPTTGPAPTPVPGDGGVAGAAEAGGVAGAAGGAAGAIPGKDGSVAKVAPDATAMGNDEIRQELARFLRALQVMDL